MLPEHKSSSNPFGNTNSGFGTTDGGWLNGLNGLSGLNELGLPNYAVLPWEIGVLPGKPFQTSGNFAPVTSSVQTVLFTPDDSKPGHGGSSSGTTSGTGGTTSTTTSATSTSSLVINISWDASVQSAPSGFTTAVMSAVQYLESQISNPVTINIDVGYGEVGGTAMSSGTLGQSEWYLTSVGYSQLVSALSADATSATDASAVASLPGTSPVNGTFWTTTAQAKALGLAPATGSSVDGYVGFSSSYPFTYNDANGVAAGTYDFNGVVLHELTEVMGRALLTGGTIGGISNSYSLYDLFHYSAPGVRDFSASTPGYFSVDGGNTNLAAFNTASGGDAGDWASSVTNDAADAFSASGVVNSFSTADLTAMDAIGWNLTSTTTSPTPTPTPTATPTPTPTAAPTGVTFSPVTSALAGAQASTGLTANQALMTVNEVGGVLGDQYSYALGGSGASAFTLSTSNNAATLSTGSAGIAGAANGRLYALTLTATDVTAGTSSPAMPFDVVVGSNGSDTVPVASIVGSSATATPTLIYGLGGADTIDASGMTGNVWFVGGAGADTMTGGSGANDYLYAAISDSTPTAMDVITNFNATMDKIDLTGLGTTLSYAGKLGKHGKLGAHSIAWQVNHGNTYIYVDASSGSQSLGSASMEIELRGGISLTASNFLHQ